MTHPEGPGRSVFFAAPDGLQLHAVDYGRDGQDAVPVVCLPGLSRNARDFERLAVYLSEQATPNRRVVCFDYRGRGLSAYDPDWTHYNVIVEAGDVIAGMAALGIEEAAIVGTSRGGLIAMILAEMRPELMRAVVLNDVGPAIEAEAIAGIARMLERYPRPADWDEAIAIQKAAMADTFPALGEDDWTFEAHARFRLIDGAIRPDHDPALAKPLEGFDPANPLPTLWPQFDKLSALPVMVIRGENSALLSKQTVDDMATVHTGLGIRKIAGQGHAPMIHTDGIPQTIERFLAHAGL